MQNLTIFTSVALMATPFVQKRVLVNIVDQAMLPKPSKPAHLGHLTIAIFLLF